MRRKIVTIQDLMNNYSVVKKIQNEKYSLRIDLRKLLLAIYSFIIFFIFYKYDIQLIPQNYMVYIKIYLIFCFIYYIIKIIYKFILGLCEIVILHKYATESDTESDIESDDHLGYWFLWITRLITFLINIFLFYSIFNLTIDLFLQYNIMLIIDLIMILIFNYYKYMYNYHIIEDYKPVFLTYPWIMIFILIFSIRINKEIDQSLFFWFTIDVAIIEEKKNNIENSEENNKL